MTAELEWQTTQAHGEVIERAFVLRRPSQSVPGVLWSPPGSARLPTVLLWHGGSGHKRTGRHVRMARELVSRAGMCCLAIDGPYHGDRVAAPLPPQVYQQLIADEGIDQVTGRMTADWLAALGELARLGLADDDNVSLFALSMGARFGIPLASALGPRLRCAVLGKFGIRQTCLLHPGLCSPELILAAASAIVAPVLMCVQWDDELFPRDGQLELFTAFAARDKLLRGRPGRHADGHDDDEAVWHEFIVRHGRRPASSPDLAAASA